MLVGSQQYLTIGDDRRRSHQLANVVRCEDFEFRPDRQHHCASPFGADIDPVTDDDRRAPSLSTTGTLFPGVLSRLQIKSMCQSCVTAKVRIISDDDARADTLRISFRVVPEPILRDIAIATRFDG